GVMGGIGWALFGTLPDPAMRIRRFFLGSLTGIATATAFGFVILPRVTDFVMLVAVLAPFLLFVGSMLARPSLTSFALGGLIGFLNTVGLASTYQSDFARFINRAAGTAVGTLAPTILIYTFYS